MEPTILKKQGIYIDLDALLDTRLSTIYGYGDEIMQGVLSDNYFDRLIDNFKGIDTDDFKTKYSNRTKSVLQNAIICKVIKMIRELVEIMLQQALTSPFHTGPKIFLNIYPYKLLPEEEDVIIRGLIHVTNKVADIEIINLNKDELTPEFIKDKLAILFKYEYNEWLDAQANNFKEKPCPEVGVIVPAIYASKEPTKEEYDMLHENKISPFRAIEILSAPVIGLKLHEVELFCANLK